MTWRLSATSHPDKQEIVMNRTSEFVGARGLGHRVVLFILTSLCVSMMECVGATVPALNSDGRYWQPQHSCPAFPKAKIDALKDSLESVVVGDVKLNNALLEASVMPTGKGGICEGLVMQAKKDVVIYRVYGKTRGSKFGGWWSLDAPERGKKDQYRKENAICNSWNDLDGGYLKLTLKKGDTIVVGTTQSVKCGDASEEYAADPTLQVYYPGPRLSDITVNEW
jgi:hypothetical protein